MKDETVKKAVFLDRDGTINIEKNYLYKISDFEFLPGVIEALRMLQEAGFLLIIITNQSGIARGYYTEDDYYILNNWMLETLRTQRVEISAVYYCPHHPNAAVEKYRIDCDCRKPKLGMYERAINDFNLDTGASFSIGDKIRDCSICRTTACRGFLIDKNEKPEVIEAVKNGEYERVKYADDLFAAAQKILSAPTYESRRIACKEKNTMI